MTGRLPWHAWAWVVLSGCYVGKIGGFESTDAAPESATDTGTDRGADTPMAGDAACAVGTTLCASACVDLMRDPNQCGSCGAACAVGESCIAGVCSVPIADAGTETGSACRSDVDCDGGVCVSGLCSAAMDGGAADAAVCVTTANCPSGEVCIGRVCALQMDAIAGDAAACSAGQTLCGATCIDLQSSNTNCGSCGTVCPAVHPACIAGACM